MAGGNEEIKKNLYKTAFTDIYLLKKDIDANRFRVRNLQKAIWSDDAVILSQMLSEIATAKKNINWADILNKPTSMPPNGAAGGDLTGTYPNPTITSFQGLSVLLGVPVLNDVITWDGTNWISQAGGGGGGVTSVSGTANRITSTGGATPVIDIAATYIGQTSITTLGTITTGTWTATKVSAVYGGTNQSTYATGDTLYASAANTLSKLTAGSNGQVLTLAAGVPSWATPTTGTVTSVATAGLISGGTITTTGTITTSMNTAKLVGRTTAGVGIMEEIGLTTTGSSGAATLTAGNLNIPTPTIAGLSPLTTKGDVFTFSTVNARLGVGADATLFMADATATTGNKWIALSGDATLANTGAITLATVNANIGTFGSATTSLTITANAKGLITAISSQTVTPAIGSITGLGTGVATFLATPSSANLASAVTDETGSGALVFATSPTLVTPLLGTPTSGVLTNCTSLPAASVNSGALVNGMTATTQAASDNSTKLATTAYVDTAATTATSWVKISTATASASATIDFTGLTSSYTSYKVVFYDVVAATNNVDMWFIIGTGGTPTYQTGATDYGWSRFNSYTIGTGTSTGFTTTPYGKGNDVKIIMATAVSNTSTSPVNGELTSYNPAGTATYHAFVFNTLARGQEGTPNTYPAWGGGHYLSTTAVTALRFKMSSGNITSGTFILYGLK